jgi:phenylpropionate dioxygenase-like ring-hydroxylating dioxygenase large terminal subunit
VNKQRIDELLDEEVDDHYMLNQWYVVERFSQMQENVPIEKYVLGKSIVIWRIGDKVHARRNHCPHEGARFTSANPRVQGKIDGATIQCGYHGWIYNEEGKATKYPSNQNTKARSHWCIDVYQTQVLYDWVWVTLSSSPMDIPLFRQWGDPTYRFVAAGPYPTDTSFGRSILNAGDVSHFAFVHDKTLGDVDHPEVPFYTVSRDFSAGIIAKDVHVWQPDPDGSGIGKDVCYTFYIPRPHIQTFDKCEQESCFCIYLVVTPNTETTCTWWMWMTFNYEIEKSDVEIERFQDEVSQDDRDLLGGIRPAKLPLDPKDGYTLIPADETALNYRKWLLQLGVTYGVIQPRKKSGQ